MAAGETGRDNEKPFVGSADDGGVSWTLRVLTSADGLRGLGALTEIRRGCGGGGGGGVGS